MDVTASYLFLLHHEAMMWQVASSTTKSH